MNEVDAAMKPRRPVRGRPLKVSGSPAGNTVRATLSPAERAQMALVLRADGLSWRRIAERLGYAGRGAAYTSAMRMALKIAPPTAEDRAAYRPRALAMLDQTWSSLIERDLASPDEGTRADARRSAMEALRIYAFWLEMPIEQTPAAQRLARFGLAVVAP